MDLKQRFDAEVGAGPTHRDVTQRVEAEQRLVRGRRLRVGAAALALAAVAGVGVAVLAPGKETTPLPAKQSEVLAADQHVQGKNSAAHDNPQDGAFRLSTRP